MINADQAVQIAVNELRQKGEKLPIKQTSATYEERRMSRGKDRKGWRVFVEFDIEMDPDHMFIEIYDDTGEIVMLPMI
jgi:hypothetical protein